MIAAFAVGRAETVLLYLSRLLAKGAIPPIPVYLNSPMAIDASGMYQRHREEHRLKDREFEAMYKVAVPVRSPDESKLLNLRGGPMIIISASGMLTGGRPPPPGKLRARPAERHHPQRLPGGRNQGRLTGSGREIPAHLRPGGQDRGRGHPDGRTVRAR